MMLNICLNWKMQIFAGIILWIGTALITAQMADFDTLLLNKDLNKKIIPDDLYLLLINKTDEEFAYEECMSTYSLCMTFQRSRTDYDYQICAINKKTSQKESFKTLCEMIYENCKNDDGNWGYFHDGECEVEFIA